MLSFSTEIEIAKNWMHDLNQENGILITAREPKYGVIHDSYYTKRMGRVSGIIGEQEVLVLGATDPESIQEVVWSANHKPKITARRIAFDQIEVIEMKKEAPLEPPKKVRSVWKIERDGNIKKIEGEAILKRHDSYFAAFSRSALRFMSSSGSTDVGRFIFQTR